MTYISTYGYLFVKLFNSIIVRGNQCQRAIITEGPTLKTLSTEAKYIERRRDISGCGVLIFIFIKSGTNMEVTLTCFSN
jgi:hypothetical protein